MHMLWAYGVRPGPGEQPHRYDHHAGCRKGQFGLWFRRVSLGRKAIDGPAGMMRPSALPETPGYTIVLWNLLFSLGYQDTCVTLRPGSDPWVHVLHIIFDWCISNHEHVEVS